MRIILRFLCLQGALLIAQAQDGAPRPIRDIRDYGARPDGQTMNTAAINRAVEEAASAGGGTVRVPAGRFLTGTVNLRSNVTLHLEAGAVLVGSRNLKDYPENPAPEPADTLEFRRSRQTYPARLEFGRFSLISAIGQNNVAIEGAGIIDGQGDHPNFAKKELVARGLTRDQAHFQRPYGLSFVRCTNVHVRGITLRNLAFWCQDYLDCDGVAVDSVTVDSPAEDRNNDGIDIDGSRQVRVSNCRIDAGDDAICLKASYRDCEDITVTNCTLSSRANGVKFGTASNGGFKRIAISNLTIRQTGAAGLALEVVDGGTMDGVVISNIVMNRVGAAIFIRLGDRGSRWMSPADHAVGAIRNVSIQNLVANVFTPYDGRPLASSISGLPGHPVDGIVLSNVRLLNLREHARSETKDLAEAVVPEQAAEYPEYSMFGALPAYGFFIRHARGITLDNVEVGYALSDHRSALVGEDVEDLHLRGWRSRTLPESEPVLRLKDVRGASINGTTAPRDTGVFLRVEGDSSGISLVGSDLSQAREPVSLAPHLPPASVRR